MTDHDELVIRTDGLTKRYSGVTALDDLNLQVPRNSIFGFLGPNGSGKSTTIKLLLNLARPSAGRATLFGMDSVSDSMSIRERVGYLAQEPRYYDEMTARETLRFAASFYGRGQKSGIEARIEEMLDLVGLSDRADRSIKGFSGGERQRLGIAQAQIHAPDLLILDEPAAALDPVGRRDVLDIMVRLRERTTIFYSTHILDDVQRVSDTVAILSRGRLVTQAPVASLLQSNDTAVYTLAVTGAVPALQARLSEASWVTAVRQEPAGTTLEGVTTMEITVNDTAAASEQLLPLVAQGSDATVVAFGRKQSTLEQVFMELVEGERSNGHN